MKFPIFLQTIGTGINVGFSQEFHALPQFVPVGSHSQHLATKSRAKPVLQNRIGFLQLLSFSEFGVWNMATIGTNPILRDPRVLRHENLVLEFTNHVERGWGKVSPFWSPRELVLVILGELWAVAISSFIHDGLLSMIRYSFIAAIWR